MITMLLFTLIYFLPTFVLARRGQQFAGMLILNFLLGWTIIGWAALLLWATVREPRVVYIPYGEMGPTVAHRL